MVQKMDIAQQESSGPVCRLYVIWGLIIGSFSVLQVTTPLILKDVVGKENAPTWQGAFTATTAFSGMVFSGLAGHYSDRLGRMEFITPWVIFFFICTLLVLYADVSQQIYPLWIARLAALSIPSTVIHAFLSDYLSGNTLLESYSYMGATYGLSALSSSFLCGFIGWYYSRVASLLFGVCLSGVAVIFTLNTRLPCASRSLTLINARTGFGEHISRASGMKKNLRTIYEDKLLRNLIVGLSILRLGNVNTQMMLVLFLNFRFGWGVPEMSILTGISGFLAVVFQLGVRFVVSSDRVLMVFFVILSAVPSVAMGYALAMTGFQVYIVSILSSLMSIGSTIFNAKIATLGTEIGVSGLALGCVSTVQNFLEILMSLLLGKLLSWSFANYSPNNIMSGLPFFMNGSFLLLVVIIVVFSHRYYGANRLSWIGST